MMNKLCSNILRNSKLSRWSLSVYSTSATSNETEAKLQYYRDLANQNENLKPSGWDEALPFEELPGPKPLPVLGNTWRFVTPKIGDFYGLDSLEIMKKLKEDYGDVVILKGIPGRAEFVHSFNPKDFETIRRNEGAWPIRNFLETLTYYRTHTKKEIFGECPGLLVQQGEEWFKVRSLINPIIMKPKSVEQYYGKIDKITIQLVDNISYFESLNKQGEMPEDFLNELNKWALENIICITLNKNLGALNRDGSDVEVQRFVGFIKESIDLLYSLEFQPSLWRIVSTPTWRRLVSVFDFVTDFVSKRVNEAAEEFEKKDPSESSEETSVLEKMLKINKIIATTMVSDMIMAGVDTTSRVLSAILYFLAKNPEKQQILREELVKLLPAKDTPVTKEVIARAPYLNAVLKESLRLGGISPNGLRTTSKDLVLGGYQIPKGTQVITANLTLLLNDKHYLKAKEFIPERWLKTTTGELSYKNANSTIYAPFGFGPRSCIGQRLAYMELEIATSKIIRNFQLTWPHPEVTFQIKMLHAFDDPLKLHVKSLP